MKVVYVYLGRVLFFFFLMAGLSILCAALAVLSPLCTSEWVGRLTDGLVKKVQVLLLKIIIKVGIE